MTMKQENKTIKFFSVLLTLSIAFLAVPQSAYAQWYCLCKDSNNLYTPQTGTYANESECNNNKSTDNPGGCPFRCGSGETPVCSESLVPANLNSSNQSSNSPTPNANDTSSEKTKTQSTGSTAKLQNPLGGTTDIPTLIGKVIKTSLGVVGAIALLMFIFGGFLWMTAGGASDKVKKGRDILVWATLGLALIFSSYAILNFIFDAFK